MAFGKEYLFYLIDPDSGEYYQWDRVDGVTTTATETPLNHAPDKWMDTEIKWTRSKTYWGLFRNFTTPYQFVLDGRHILKHIDDTQGATGKCRMVIKKLVSTDGTYVEYYSGDLDFSKCRINRTGATINVMEGGLVDLINNNESVSYEIPIDPLDSDILYMDGIKLRAVMNYKGVNYGAATADESEIPLPLAYYSQDGEYPIAITGDSFPGIAAGLENYIIFTSLRTQDVTFRLQEEITFSNDPSSVDSAEPQIKIYIFANTETVLAGTPLNVATLQLWAAGTPLAPGASQSYTIDQSYFYALNEGNVVIITANFSIPTPTGSNAGYIDIATGGRLTIASEFINGESFVQAYRYSQLWAKIIDKATGGLYAGTSDFLVDGTIAPDDYYGNIPWSTLVTSGDAIRGFSNASIKTTLTDVYKAAFCLWNLGLIPDIDNGEAVLMLLSDILDSTNEICDLGEVSGFEMESAIDLMGNIINGGSKSHDSNTLNGRQEFNVETQTTTPISNVNTPLNWESPYYEGMFDIEQVRVNISEKTTTDAKQDNETYIIESNINLMTGLVTLQRLQNEPGNAAGGIVYPDNAYNLGITPKRNLKRAELLTNSICDLHDGEYLVFQSNTRNKELITALDSNGNIAEKNNEVIGTDKLFKPKFFNFTSRVPKNLIGLINTSNGRGYVSFKWLGVPLKAFPWEIGLYPATNGAYKIKALCHPDVDLTTIP